WLHWASTALGGHGHGRSCGPEKTGPPLGWLTIVTEVEAAPGAEAVTTFEPLASPLSRPSKIPFGRRANWLVASLPFKATDTADGSVPAGRSSETSAWPPETRSARVERTLICSGDAADAAGASTSAATTAHNAARTDRT